ncbi:hypothetical protein HNO88_003681 [Novosphingobium chloroacetimidivorans]|uniref:Uncharacterized protein n=1 Tax=Novosphingobium chloroacetimidivorans TaxID=1428314 RepID=A0A7W7KDQ4_9SPHN|nr:hypothetical protein [Novosphingobium chloroacetimidivorans]MBB4860338.1 hypothetical protein [Novosphingobium chloroacetimidivorans]
MRHDLATINYLDDCKLVVARGFDGSDQIEPPRSGGDGASAVFAAAGDALNRWWERLVAMARTDRSRPPESVVQAEARRGRALLLWVLAIGAVALACHLVAQSALDGLYGQLYDRSAKPGLFSPADRDVRRAQSLGAYLLLEHEDGQATVLRRGLRTGENGTGSAISAWWRGSVLQPLVSAGFLQAMFKVDPWLSFARLAPRRAGVVRDCSDCPQMVLLSAGLIGGDQVWWSEGSPTVDVPALAIAREPLRAVPCQWQGAGCVAQGANARAAPVGFRNPLQDARLVRAFRQGYRLLTPEEYVGLRRLAAADPSAGLGSLLVRRDEWVCRDMSDPATCWVFEGGEPKLPFKTGAIRLVRDADRRATSAAKVATDAAEPTPHPQRVYIQFAGALTRPQITAANGMLRAAGWQVQSASGERIASAAGQNQVRYGGDNAAAARELAQAVDALGLASRPVTSRYYAPVGADVLEIWISN